MGWGGTHIPRGLPAERWSKSRVMEGSRGAAPSSSQHPLTFSPWAPFSPCRKAQMDVSRWPPAPLCPHHIPHLPASHWSQAPQGAPAALRGPERKRSMRKLRAQRQEDSDGNVPLRAALTGGPVTLVPGGPGGPTAPLSPGDPCRERTAGAEGKEGQRELGGITAGGAQWQTPARAQEHEAAQGDKAQCHVPIPWLLSLPPFLEVPGARGVPGDRRCH